MKTQKTYKNTAKINKHRSEGLCKTQKTYKNLAKTNKNWSGGRLVVIWGVYVKLKKHTKTCVQLIQIIENQLTFMYMHGNQRNTMKINCWKSMTMI